MEAGYFTVNNELYCLKRLQCPDTINFTGNLIIINCTQLLFLHYKKSCYASLWDNMYADTEIYLNMNKYQMKI